MTVARRTVRESPLESMRADLEVRLVFLRTAATRISSGAVGTTRVAWLGSRTVDGCKRRLPKSPPRPSDGAHEAITSRRPTRVVVPACKTSRIRMRAPQ